MTSLERELPSLPAGYSSRWLEDRLEIVHKWRQAWAIPWFLAAVTPAVVAALWPPARFLIAVLWPYFIIPSWLALAQALNRTRFTLECGGVDIRHGPIPGLRRGGFFDKSEIVQIDVEDHGPKSRESWYIGLQLKNGKKLWVVEACPSYDEAKRIERVLEEQLEIVDVPAGGGVRVPKAPAAIG